MRAFTHVPPAARISRRRRPALLAAALTFVAVTATAACSSDDSGAADDAAPAATTQTSFDLPQGSEPVDLDPEEFTTEIDNPYWPMVPGTRWIFREIDEDGTEVEVIVLVTDETRELANGVTALVVRDWVTEDGELIEDTFDWYAQDSDGNVWYMGEDTAEFEDGEITTTAGSWEAGVDGALPGVLIPADPQPGMKYRQEYYEGEAEDNGEVLSIAEMAEVPFGQFTDVLLTKDTVALEPDVLEYKFYAPGTGPVLALGISGGGGREELITMDMVAPDSASGPLGSPTS